MATIQTIDNELASAIRPKLNANFNALKVEVEAATTAIAGKETAGAASTAVAAHVAASNPHSQYALESDVTSALAGKAAASHSHATADVTGLDAALAGKAASSHSHAISDSTGLQAALDAKAPSASPTLTGTVAMDVPSPNVTDLGTVANTGTVTLTNATSKFSVTLTGTANTIALPSTPPGDKRELAIAFTSGSAKTLTIPSLYRIDSPSLGSVTSVSFDATTTKAVLLFLVSGSAFWGVAVLGDTPAIATSQLANVSAGNLDSGETDELARTVDVKAAIESIESPNAVTASAALSTDNSLVRADGVSRGVQTSSVVVDDDGVATTPGDYIAEGEEAGSIQLSDADATSPETVTITAPEDITTSFVQQLPSAKGTGFLWGEVAASVVVEYWDRRTVTAGGTTGAQTINKPYGSVNFAAAATSLVVTNSLVTSSSVILATVATNDSTMKTVTAVAGSGSFTLYANAAATGETRVNFVVF